MLEIPSPFHIRDMTLADLPAVMAIENAVMPTPAKESMYRFEITQNEMAHYHVLTCPQLVGYAGYWLMGDEAHVSIIAVHPALRGRNLGELLFIHLLFDAMAAAAQVATLEVRVSNVPAQGLYRKYLLEVVGERPNYYKKTGEDALIMTGPPLDAAYGRFLNDRWLLLQARLKSAANTQLPCIT